MSGTIAGMKAVIAEFRKRVWQYYCKNGRHTLPWRKTRDPYKILVSEVMLQQTQVERVIPFYNSFVTKFPTLSSLSNGPLSDVLRAWQGLGYNRRAKMLWKAAQEIEARHGGVVPRSVTELEALSGVGPYTARAIAAFAFNADVVFVETNIRTVVMHHFFPKAKKVSDEKIEEVVKRALPRGRAREWYSALMDYGSHLKSSGVRLNVRSKHYTKQKPFKGSAREARGMILRSLAKKSTTETVLISLGSKTRIHQLQAQLQNLVAEKLVTKRGSRYSLGE